MTSDSEYVTEDPQTAEALLEAVDSLLFKAMHIQVPYMPDHRERMANLVISRMEGFVGEARRLIMRRHFAQIALEFEAQADAASAPLHCDQCDKVCAIDNAPPHHWYCPWCGTLLEIEGEEEGEDE